MAFIFIGFCSALLFCILVPNGQDLRLVGHMIVPKPAQLRHICENGADKGLLGTGPDHIPVGPLAKNGGNGVNDDGFTGAGLAGQHVKAPAEGNIGLVNDGDILNVE